MDNFRVYGKPPYTVALLHGGPGASGEMAPVARELQDRWGVLEPLQTGMTVEGQVEELRLVLENKGSIPVILVGYSWGAWLGWLLTARHPSLVQKLILVSSGPFEERYAPEIQETRLKRLTKKERDKLEYFLARPEDPLAFSLLGELFAKVDTYDPLPLRSESLELRPDIFKSVWGEAAELRKTGKLLEAARLIRCPVVAIHGDHDPHPAEGVQRPLAGVLRDFRFILLGMCGHAPWMEKRAREEFFSVLSQELTQS